MKIEIPIDEVALRALLSTKQSKILRVLFALSWVSQDSDVIHLRDLARLTNLKKEDVVYSITYLHSLGVLTNDCIETTLGSGEYARSFALDIDIGGA